MGVRTYYCEKHYCKVRFYNGLKHTSCSGQCYGVIPTTNLDSKIRFFKHTSCS